MQISEVLLIDEAVDPLASAAIFVSLNVHVLPPDSLLVLLCQPLLQCISNVFSLSLYVQVLAAVCVSGVCDVFLCR